MPSGAWARGIVFMAAAIWVALAFILGVPVDKLWLKYVGVIAALVVLLLLAFDVFAWRWLPEWIVKRPNIRGTWRAELRSNWLKDDGQPLVSECFIVIHQTYTTMCVEVLFPGSDSTSTSADIVKGGGRPSLWYTYRSEAHAPNRDGNPPHRGAVSLFVETSPRRSLAGDYWTERGTTGRIQTSGHSKKIAGSFMSAQSLDYAS